MTGSVLVIAVSFLVVIITRNSPTAESSASSSVQSNSCQKITLFQCNNGLTTLAGSDGKDGRPGPPGAKGDVGLPGTCNNTDVSRKLDELLERVQRLERANQVGSSRQHLSDFGDGHDGQLSVPSHKEHQAHCAHVTSLQIKNGTKVVSVSSCSYFRPGDEVIFHQTQHPTAAGRYEFSFIKSCISSSLTLTHPLQNGFQSGVYSGRNPEVTQITRVPNHSSVTIRGTLTASEWDGHCGGIVAFRATGDVTVSGLLSVKGKGFRGAPKFDSPVDYVPGYVGESELVSYGAIRQSDGIGSSGGAGNGQGGGYGGAHRTIGSRPERGAAWCDHKAAGPPTSVLAEPNSESIHFGGSGSASGSHGNQRGDTRKGSKGGASGGIVLIYAARGFAVTGTIDAGGLAGEDGYKSSCCHGRDFYQPMGGGGGGAGGAVMITRHASRQSLKNILVDGGAGGKRRLETHCNPGGAGGSGGMGWETVVTV